MITLDLGPADKRHAFCETYSAPPLSPWHIRELTSAGRKPGGGADTKALCGRIVAWDLNVPITRHHLGHACGRCVAAYIVTDEVPER